MAHSESCPGQSDGVWHWGSVVVVLEVGSVVVVAGAVVVVGLVVVVGGVMVVVVVVVGCVAARLSAASTMVLHCASSLSASAESPLPNAASSRSSLIAVARASRCAPSVARLVAKVGYCESSPGLPAASARVSPTSTAVANRPTDELSCL